MTQQVITRIEIQVENRDRFTVLLRLILVIPICIYSASLTSFSDHNSSMEYIAGILIAPVILALLFRGIYPSYVLQFNKALIALSLRIAAFVMLLTDDYPTIEANPKFTAEFPEIDGGKSLSRGMPLVKWFLAIPLYVVGAVYIVYSLILTFVAWITIIFTGVYPEWCAAPVVGTIAYWNRVYGYAFVLVTDEYPTFSL